MSHISNFGSGPLDGISILRFAHAFESGGGTERYLDDLDFALLERNAMTIVRVHLTRNPAPCSPTEEKIGLGRLIRTRLPVHPGTDGSTDGDMASFRERLKQFVRDRLLYNPLIWRSMGAKWTAARQLPPEPGQAIGAGAAVAEALRAHRIDLVMLHFFGGSDADEVLREAQAAQTPVAVLNHYSNDRFLHLVIRKHAMAAEGVAGVNGLQVPRYLSNRFTNLSDGIDTAFFRRSLARPLVDAPEHPIILLPARVVREKGQLDLVRAVSLLRRSGLECCIAFAGRVDSSAFVDELKREIAQAGMNGCVRFLGGLSVEELRDWYAASSVVAFPTYHHEGLGRVIVEAQAMETPVIAYATGGVPDAIVSGQTGYLLPTGDIAGLAARLRELLLSAPLRAQIGAEGRAAAEQQFSLAALADRHERFYAQTVAAFKARSDGNAPKVIAHHPR